MIGITVLKFPVGPNAEAENRNSTTPIVVTTAATAAIPTIKIVFKHPDLIHAPRASSFGVAPSAAEIRFSPEYSTQTTASIGKIRVPAAA